MSIVDRSRRAILESRALPITIKPVVLHRTDSAMDRFDRHWEAIYRLRHTALEAMRYCEDARARLDETVSMLQLADQMAQPLLGEKRQ